MQSSSFSIASQKLKIPQGEKVVILLVRDLGLFDATVSSFQGLYQSGLKLSGTLMAPCIGFMDLVDWSRKNPKAALGLQFTFTNPYPNFNWVPIASRNRFVTPIMDNRGYLPLNVQDLEAIASPDQLLSEMEAQLHFARSFRFFPDFLHCPAPFLGSSDFYDQFLKAGPSDRLPLLLGGPFPNSANKNGKNAAETAWDIPLLDRTYSVGDIPDPNARRTAYLSLFQSLPPGIHCVEIMPAIPTSQLQHVAPDWKARVADHQLFSDPAFLDELGKHCHRFMDMEELTTFLPASFEHGPDHCGQEKSPGVNLNVARDVDYSNMPSTQDQLGIETYLEKVDLKDKSILHIGIGNSKFALRFGSENTRIDGLTVSPPEFEKAQQLALPFYRPLMLNKYGNDLKSNLNPPYDIIIDNNLASFACCQTHFLQMIRAFVDMLSPDGQILTHNRGLKCYIKHKAFSLRYADLKKLERILPVRVSPHSDSVFSIRRSERAPLAPEEPTREGS